MSSVRKSIISNCEKKFLTKNIKESTRLDGRALDEFRNVEIEFGKEWGCCCVILGKTRVLAQVSCEIQEPKSSRPSEGILNLNVELNPIAAPNFDPTRQTNLSVQLNRLLEKCLKDSKTVDLESLCVQMNKKVWALKVDINVLNHEGNILDCASIAALSALIHFRRPDVTCNGEEFIIHTYKQRDPIPTVILHYPVCITYSIFDEGNVVIADPNLLEEEVADGFLSVSLNSYKELCGLHLGGKVDLSSHVILQTVNKAAVRANMVVQLIKDAIEQDDIRRQTKEELGFHKSTKSEDRLEIMSIYLDQWSIAGKKNKSKHKKPKQNANNSEDPQMNTKLLENGSAVLIQSNTNNSEGYEISEDEVVFVDKR